VYRVGEAVDFLFALGVGGGEDGFEPGFGVGGGFGGAVEAGCGLEGR
jgi:hypothetical protein